MIHGIFDDTYKYRQFGLTTTFVTAPVHDMAFAPGFSTSGLICIMNPMVFPPSVGVAVLLTLPALKVKSNQAIWQNRHEKSAARL